MCGITADENELATLEFIHLFVETLDRYFGNVCELDIIFNFHRACYLLDELILGGYHMESSKRQILRAVETQDDMMEGDDPNAGASGQSMSERAKSMAGAAKKTLAKKAREFQQRHQKY